MTSSELLHFWKCDSTAWRVINNASSSSGFELAWESVVFRVFPAVFARLSVTQQRRKYDHISDGLRSLKWLPIREKLILNDATMMHKCINKLVPDYLADMFKSRSQVHNRQTRSSGALDIPLCRLSTGQRSFAFRGAKLWNSLNDNIKSLKCPRNFRRHLANVLLS